MIDVQGQVVSVTGAGRGPGEACARLLAARGAQVALHDAGVERDGGGADPAFARAVRDAVVDAGGRSTAHLQDLATLPLRWPPGVVMLASRDCPFTGHVLKAAGGTWSLHQVATGRQADLGAEASPEDVLAWATRPVD